MISLNPFRAAASRLWIQLSSFPYPGKTTLIKALTGDSGLQPRNQLFATLDVTVHAGQLPSHMTVLYVDTIGFLSQLPHQLIDSFSATLDDIKHSVSLAESDLAKSLSSCYRFSHGVLHSVRICWFTSETSVIQRQSIRKWTSWTSLRICKCQTSCWTRWSKSTTKLILLTSNIQTHLTS